MRGSSCSTPCQLCDPRCWRVLLPLWARPRADAKTGWGWGLEAAQPRGRGSSPAPGTTSTSVNRDVPPSRVSTAITVTTTGLLSPGCPRGMATSSSNSSSVTTVSGRPSRLVGPAPAALPQPAAKLRRRPRPARRRPRKPPSPIIGKPPLPKPPKPPKPPPVESVRVSAGCVCELAESTRTVASSPVGLDPLEKAWRANAAPSGRLEVMRTRPRTRDSWPGPTATRGDSSESCAPGAECTVDMRVSPASVPAPRPQIRGAAARSPFR